MFFYKILHGRCNERGYILATSHSLAHHSRAHVVQGCRKPVNALGQCGSLLATARIDDEPVSLKNILPPVPLVEFFPVVGTHKQQKFTLGVGLFQRGKGVYRV